MNRRPQLRLIEGGLSGRQRRDENNARLRLYGYANRQVRAELRRVDERPVRPVPPNLPPAA